MSKKKHNETIHIEIDQAKVALRVSREVFGSVKGSIAHKSEKDYNRKSKKSQREKNKLRKGEYDD